MDKNFCAEDMPAFKKDLRALLARWGVHLHPVVNSYGCHEIEVMPLCRKTYRLDHCMDQIVW